jgi:pimeloyl-ACP methyl ester carboxylesterase
MGPGFSSHVERLRLGKLHPEIDFWDQPRLHGADAYQRLAAESLRKFDQMIDAGAGKIRLIGHSFGAQLALKILQARPDLVDSCLFIATLNQPAHGFRHCLGKIMHELDSSQDLDRAKQLTANQYSQLSRQEFEAIIELLLKIPDFTKHYWFTAEAYFAYTKDMESGPGLDFVQFMDTSRDFMAQPRFAPFKKRPPMRILFGDHDPLVDLKFECQEWNKVLPGISVEVKKNLGHHLHLEDTSEDILARDLKND